EATQILFLILWARNRSGNGSKLNRNSNGSTSHGERSGRREDRIAQLAARRPYLLQERHSGTIGKSRRKLLHSKSSWRDGALTGHCIASSPETTTKTGSKKPQLVLQDWSAHGGTKVILNELRWILPAITEWSRRFFFVGQGIKDRVAILFK